ncbi:CHASE domain-containing sensor histidine kinase [Archangium lansingense]|uniref:histidine kinase n=1 Tax=Archangium lansingense TaxID=2995310 RepID=A0ABT4AEW3_9BACT|nr:ATP-binding protein [Archangium lansinium]MCY1080219.1 ATP-binding protein [Archangium lansinium]
MRSCLSSLAQHLRRLWSAYAVLLASVIFSAIAYQRVEQTVDAEAHTRVEAAAEETQRALDRRVDHYLGVVYGVRGLFVASHEVSAQELEELLTWMGTKSRYPAMQGVAYAAVSPTKVTVTRVGPLESNRVLLGEDLGTDPIAREAMRTAAMTGQPFAITRSGPGWEPEDMGLPTVWIFLPVYQVSRKPGPSGVLHPESAPVVGFVVGIFRVDDLLQNLGPVSAVVDYEVYEGPALDPDHLLYDDDGLPDVGRQSSGEQLVRASTLPMVGRPWTFYFSTRPGFEEIGVERVASIAILIGGSLMGVLLFGIIATQVRGRVAAERLTAELRSSEQAARQSKSMAEQAEHRAAMLAEASRVLASSLDDPARLGAVAQRVVPFMADGCIIELVQPDGSLAPVASAQAGPEAQRWMAESRRLYPLRWDGHSLVSTQPSTQDSGAALVVPLSAREQLIGAMSFFLGPGPRQFDAVTCALAEDLARRVSAAVDNGHLVEEAHAAVHLRDDFLVVAAHELKTPLTALQLQITHMGRLLGKGEILLEPFRDKLGKVRRHLVRLTNLVEELLDVSRIASGHFLFHLEKMDLGRLGREVVDRFGEQAAAKSATISVTEEGDLVGVWDSFRLDQVLTNLVANALKYGLGRPISLSLVGGKDTVRVMVRDEGIGIAPADVLRIFNRFERAASSDHYGGLGLGLFITRQIVEALGGRIFVKSEVGLGSTFIVELPRTVPDSPVMAGEPERRAGPMTFSQSNSEHPV